MWLCCCFPRPRHPRVLISSCPPVQAQLPETCQLLGHNCVTLFEINNPPPCPDIIDIKNDKTITEIKLKDCMFISIVNCPKITKIPCFSHFTNLETLKIIYCDIRVFDLHIPACLRNLEISYCGLQEFRPQNTPQNLAELNLSFNKLKLIPRCLERLPSATSINLKNNDFWFDMYSDISPGMISPEVVDELILAHKLNLLGTSKILYAINILEQKRFTDEAKALQRATRVQYEIRKKEVKTTADNAQNVHLTSVQEGMADSIRYLKSYNSMHYIAKDKIKSILNLDAHDWDKIQTLCNNQNKHSIYQMTYFEVLTKVLQIIYDSPHKSTLLEILRDELIDGLESCFTGQITRMVNSLNGFVKHIKVSINHKEELSNTIIAIRKKYSAIYTDIDIYTQETIPIVWQLLEDSCVPEHEHAAWLEYV